MVDIHAVVNADETDLSVFDALLKKEFPKYSVHTEEQCKGSIDVILTVSDRNNPSDDEIKKIDRRINELKEQAKKSL